jgi:two-component system, response regulator / RNA-binding antiterminator
MSSGAGRRLRVLLADGHEAGLENVARIVTRLGHTVLARETDIGMVAALTELEPPDVAIVVVGESTDHALDQIRRIVREATSPVIVVLRVEDAAFVEKAAKCGVFAYIADGASSDDKLESAISIVLHRFAEYHDLQGAFGRRALTERAKGILMERHATDEEHAFAMLRDRSRSTGRKLVDIAQAVVDAQALLPDSAKRSANVEQE